MANKKIPDILAGIPSAVTRLLGVNPDRTMALVTAAELIENVKPIRPVATGVTTFNSDNSGNKQSMTRKSHFMRAAVSKVQLLYVNWRTGLAASESLNWADSATVSVAIEYPEGTYTRVTFGGSNDGVMAAGGEVISDWIAVNIPVGAQFWTRTWWRSAGGIIYLGKSETADFGEAMAFGGTTPDVVMGGAISRGGAGTYAPTAILGRTDRPGIYMQGDSRVMGQADSYSGALTNDVGILQRSIGSQFGYICAAAPAERVAGLVGNSNANNAKRRSLALRFCTSAVLAEGINDITGALGAATTIANLQTWWATFKPLRVYACTIAPVTGGTYADEAGQTVHASNTDRTTVNEFIRATNKAYSVFDLCDAVELPPRNSGKWRFPNFTGDGTHELQAACIAIQNSRVIDMGRLT